MSRRYADPAKQIRNRFCYAALEGQPKGAADASWIREGVQRYKEFREAAPELHTAFEDAIVTGQITEDTDFDAMLADAVRAVAARKPGSAAFADLPARVATPSAPRPGSSIGLQGAGTATMPDMEAMSSTELQAATLDAFGGFARATRRM